MPVNPTKRTHFKVIIPGLATLDPDIVASIQIPNVTLNTAEHTEANFDVETPTTVKVENFELRLYEDQAQRNNFVVEKLPFDQDTGALRPPSEFKFNMVVQQLAWDRQTPVRQWTIKQCWLKSARLENSERTNKDNQVRICVLSATSCKEEPL